jgi:DNA-binding GntR family transcriptional regulator
MWCGLRPLAAHSKLFGCARNEALLAREHVVYDAKGQPVLCGETTYRAGFSISYAQEARR